MALKQPTPKAKNSTPAPAQAPEAPAPVQEVQATLPLQEVPAQAPEAPVAEAVSTPAPEAAKAPKKRMPDREFIGLYNASTSFAEVAAKTGLKEDTVRNRARDLAAQGIPLRAFEVQRAPRIAPDIEDLKQFAANTLPEGVPVYKVRKRAAKA